MSGSRPWLRVIVMPLVILVVAAALAVWSARQQQEQARQVRQQVLALCDDLTQGRDAMARLRGTERTLARQLLDRLAPIVREGRTLEVVASPGDTNALGELPTTATHTAVIRVDGVDVLGIRAVHPDRDGDVVIIGFWIPDEASLPDIGE